jgi:hypothetical protein
MRVRGNEIFPDHPQAATLHYLNCRPCKAFVRCSDGGWDPLGELGDPSVRRVRKATHDANEDLVRRTTAANKWPEDVVREAIASWIASLGGPSGPVAGMDSDECERLREMLGHPAPPLAIHVYRISKARDELRGRQTRGDRKKIGEKVNGSGTTFRDVGYDCTGRRANPPRASRT